MNENYKQIVNTKEVYSYEKMQNDIRNLKA